MSTEPSVAWYRRAAPWVLVAVCCLGASRLLEWLGLPSAYLFGGLLTGLALSLTGRVVLSTPAPVRAAGFVILGVVTGQYLDAGVLHAVASEWLPVTVVLVATLCLAPAFGLPMARFSSLNRPTAVFGMVAGGAAGVIGVSEEAGADSRFVAIMQYVRLLVILVTLPAVIVLTGSDGGGSGPVAETVAQSPLRGILFVAVAGLSGVIVARLIRLPAGALLGPMCLVGALSLAAPGIVEPVPALFVDFALVIIGLDVGLRFNRSVLRAMAGLVPIMAGAGAVMVAVCAGLAGVLAWWTGRDLLDCYLATTPGGLPAVLATALEGGVDVPFVTALQVLRVFMMLLTAPLLGRFLRRR